jgi:DNA (cytosine-5)-methyltransferase 1
VGKTGLGARPRDERPDHVGAGGQALGYEQAGIDHAALVELDRHACATLRLNRPEWKVIEQDLNRFSGSAFKGVDIISGGLPCPPFSIAGKQLGAKDERNLFPAMIRLVDEIRPRAVMIENVRGILDAVFEDYRQYVATELLRLGYQPGWKLTNASDFGVPQLRPRVVFVALRKEYTEHFRWPEQSKDEPDTVGQVLHELMAANGWQGAEAWSKSANEIAPPSWVALTSTAVPISGRLERGGHGRRSALSRSTFSDTWMNGCFDIIIARDSRIKTVSTWPCAKSLASD